MRDKLVCSVCGGDNVHILAWIDANTNEYRSEFLEESQDQWCDDCGEHYELVNQSEYNK